MFKWYQKVVLFNNVAIKDLCLAFSLMVLPLVEKGAMVQAGPAH